MHFPCGNIAIDDSVCADDGAVADGHAHQNGGLTANPDVLADFNRRRDKPLLAERHCRIAEPVILVTYRDVFRNFTVWAHRNLLVRDNDGADAQMRFADINDRIGFRPYSDAVAEFHGRQSNLRAAASSYDDVPPDETVEADRDVGIPQTAQGNPQR